MFGAIKQHIIEDLVGHDLLRSSNEKCTEQKWTFCRNRLLEEFKCLYREESPEGYIVTHGSCLCLDHSIFFMSFFLVIFQNNCTRKLNSCEIGGGVTAPVGKGGQEVLTRLSREGQGAGERKPGSSSRPELWFCSSVCVLCVLRQVILPL